MPDEASIDASPESAEAPFVSPGREFPALTALHATDVPAGERDGPLVMAWDDDADEDEDDDFFDDDDEEDDDDFDDFDDEDEEDLAEEDDLDDDLDEDDLDED